ncbi:hypothetical protein ACP4OV_009210 [Aristida adscensionis]
MDLVAGALGNLPAKLLELLKDEYKLQTGVKEQIRFLSRELESMHAALRKVAQVPPDQLDEQVRLWARDVREGSYDMEDVLDTFLVCVEGPPKEPADEDKVKRLMKKMGNLFRLSKSKARHEIAVAIETISKQLQDVARLRGQYTVDDIVAKPTAETSVDPRLSALYTKESQLIGIEEPRDELIRMLSVAEGDESNKEMKIVSVVGFGGLGKTTLAKAVYEKLTVGVSYKAFVPVGRNPDLKKVLRDILIDLHRQRYTMEINLLILDQRQLIDELREFLKDERYFIVMDDIWDLASWNMIRFALYDNTLGSKILVTTRNHVVAEKVGCSYKMEPLSHERSKMLFYGRIFGSEDKCPAQYSVVSEKILKKCGGVPLAIITTSSLLANKPRNIKEWYEVYDSIGSGLGSNSDMDNMRKILSLSYYDLPSHLKTCFLYLSIFPEDYEICKNRLIMRWIAEDFVQLGEGDNRLIEVGQCYFNELINRSLVQPARVDDEGMPCTCRVHDMLLDLICSLSREENFVTSALGDTKPHTSSLGRKVRRLSVHNTILPTNCIEKVRSLNIFSPDVTNLMASLSNFHLLRVLDLVDCNLKNHTNLRFIGKLFHLRFLGLSNTGYSAALPEEIGRLQFLQTLDLCGTDVKELPSSIVGLRQLMFLFVNRYTRLPNGLGNLKTLEKLAGVGVDSAYSAESLGHLTQLSSLVVYLKEDEEHKLAESMYKALVASLGNLHKIRSLAINSDVAANLEGSVESLGNLRWLRIYEASSLPTWINPVSVPFLSCLDIWVNQVRKEDIQVLGILLALRSLILRVVSADDIQVAERFMVSADAFPCVERCLFYGFAAVPSMFPRGAMPRLKEFDFCIQVEDFSNGDFDDLAMGHLPSLGRVHVELYCKNRSSKEMVVKVKQVLRHEADVHSNHPSVECDTRWVTLEEEETRKPARSIRPCLNIMHVGREKDATRLLSTQFLAKGLDKAGKDQKICSHFVDIMLCSYCF